jgi:hypothetical protein
MMVMFVAMAICSPTGFKTGAIGRSPGPICTKYQTKWGDDVGPLSHIMFEEQRDRDYNARVPGHPASDEH